MSRRVAFGVAVGVAIAALLPYPLASAHARIMPQTCRPPLGGSA